MKIFKKDDKEEDTEAPPVEESLSHNEQQPETSESFQSSSSASRRCNRKRWILLVISVTGVILAVGLTLGLVLLKEKNEGVGASSASESSNQNAESSNDQDSINDNNNVNDKDDSIAFDGERNPQDAPSAYVWPHTESDISLNPKVRLGQLESNGFKYMILRHPWPQGKVSMLMHFDAGSFQEDDNQLGLAHFLEHMLFNGLKNFAGNDVIAEMQRVGMAIGPHINAYTTFHETVYKLNTPDNTTELMDLCFTVLRDWLDGALLEDDAIENERGVVLSELRGGDLVRERLNRQLYNFLIPGTRIPSRWPIGTVESLQTIPPEQFVEFYNEYYTPERATLVIAGDIDVDEMEARILETFSNATNPENPGTDPDLGAVIPGTGFRTTAFADDQFKYHEVYLYTTRDFTSKPDTEKKRHEDISLSLANAILARRFNRLVLEEDTPISYGTAATSSLKPALNGWVTVDAVAGRLEEAVMVLEQEFRRFITFGVTPSEFEELKASVLNTQERAVQGEETQEASKLATQLLKTISDRKVFSTPEENLRIVSEALDALTPERVHADFVDFWDTKDIALVFLTKEVFDNTTDVLQAAYNKSMSVVLDPPTDDSNLTFAYTDFGAPGTIISDDFQADLGIRQLVLSNNIRVNMKKTDFEDNSIIMEARFGSGKLSQPTDMTDLDLFAAYVMDIGGLGQHSNDELSRLLSGKSASAQFSATSDYFSLSGETEPEDLMLQLQLMTARLSDPGYREEAVRLYRHYIPSRLNDFTHTTAGPWQQLSRFLKSGDERYGIPTEAQMMSYEVEDVMTWIESQLSNSYLELSIVGEFPDDSLDLILKTIGTLPMRADSPDVSSFNNDLSFPRTPQAVEFTYDSKDPQAVVAVAFEIMSQTEDTINATRYMYVLATAFRNRLFNEIREELGAAYSPATSSSPYVGFDHGEFLAYASVAPENVTVVAERIQQIAASLSEDGVSEDELVRALEPILSGFKESKKSNGNWLSILGGSQAHPYFLDWARTKDQVYESVTTQDINELAKTYLSLSKSIVVSMVPVDLDGGGALRNRSLARRGEKTHPRGRLVPGRKFQKISAMNVPMV